MTEKDTLIAQLAELDEQEAERQRLNADQAAWADRRRDAALQLEEIERAERREAAAARLLQEADDAEAAASALVGEAREADRAADEVQAELDAMTSRIEDLRARAAQAASEAERATAEARDDDALAARRLVGDLVAQADAVAPSAEPVEARLRAHRERAQELRAEAEASRDLSRLLAWQALVDPAEEAGATRLLPTSATGLNPHLGPVGAWESAAQEYRKTHHLNFAPSTEAVKAMADRHGRLNGYADADEHWRAWADHASRDTDDDSRTLG